MTLLVGDNSNNDCHSDSEVIYQDGEVCTLPSVELTPKLGSVFDNFYLKWQTQSLEQKI